jgi:hypothetical protein
MNRSLLAVTLLAALTACTQRGPQPDTELTTPRSQLGPKELAAGRFKVERVGVFSDGLAYGDKRGIYVITDTKTGQEFVGVSGVGISELGRHQSGKTSVSDER